MQIETEKIYHIYNRGVDKRDIFIDYKDFVRFIRSMREFNNVNPIGSLYEKDFRERNNERAYSEGVKHPIGCFTPLVEFISYCLLNNHYHFLLMQNRDGGISEFMKRLNGGYTNYFNKKYNRSGSLFEGKFKIIEISSYSHLLKLAVYVNCNSEIHKISLAKNWPWSSFLDYMGKREGNLCNRKIIMNEFNNSIEFKNFCLQVLPDIMEIKEIRRNFLE